MAGLLPTSNQSYPEPPIVSPIQSKFNELESCLDCLRENLAKLAQQLAPVRFVQNASDEKVPKGLAQVPAMSDMEANIEALCQKAHDITTNIRILQGQVRL